MAITKDTQTINQGGSTNDFKCVMTSTEREEDKLLWLDYITQNFSDSFYYQQC